MKSGENCTSGFREENILKLHNFIHAHVHSPGARADNPPGDKILIVTNMFYYFNHTL